jgi:RNA polymerase sigma-54 factor
MSMDMNQSILPQQTVKASPQLVAANHILALSSIELQQLINKELEENPALEMEELPTCPMCGRPLPASNVCLSCMPVEQFKPADRTEYFDEGTIWPPLSGSNTDDEEFDPTTRIPSQMSLAEHLTLSLQAQLPTEDGRIIEYLVGNLDEDGYLRCTVDEVCRLFGVDAERVERAIRHLQAMEPVGVGARDLRECLLIQLAYIEAQGYHQPYAYEIIDRYLTALSEHKYGQIAAALGITTDLVHIVSDFIKKNLNPYPARGYLGTNLAPSNEHASRILPDVIISRREQAEGGHTYEIEVVESKRFFLHVNTAYSQLAAEMSSHQSTLSEEERRHIQQYVSRAKLFIANINQRRQTLYKITRCLVELQTEFLDKGIRYLRPLTRARVAAELGMHESTVSRATASKYVMLPDGKVIPFSNFFVANLSIKDVIKELIANEVTPLTDQELADILTGKGIQVARRTVAKYREQLGILPSSLR